MIILIIRIVRITIIIIIIIIKIKIIMTRIIIANHLAELVEVLEIQTAEARTEAAEESSLVLRTAELDNKVSDSR